jgi:hypothetical protein
MINGHINHIFVENSHERPFWIIPKANTYGFFTKKWSPPGSQDCDLWQGKICGVRCTSHWSMINGQTTPIFVENIYERPFSIIPKAKTYGFLTKKWCPLEIQECNPWKENIWGVRCTSLCLMIYGHISPIFVEISHERQFLIIPKANTYGFWPRIGLHQISHNVTYGNIAYVGWGVWSSGRWSMATQPPFLTKIAMNGNFQ